VNIAFVALVSDRSLAPFHKMQIDPFSFLEFCAQQQDGRLQDALLSDVPGLLLPFLIHSGNQAIRSAAVRLVQTFSKNNDLAPAILWCLLQCMDSIGLETEKLRSRFDSLFQLIAWLVERTKIDIAELGETLLRCRSWLMEVRAPFRRSVLYLDSLLVEHLNVPTEQFTDLFASFFDEVDRFTPKQLEHSLRVYLPLCKKRAGQDPSLVTPVVNSDQFVALVAAVARTAQSSQECGVMNEFIGFLDDLMEVDEEWRSVFGAVIGR
jgi:hypothetical protein